jgi:hypothetical protein
MSWTVRYYQSMSDHVSLGEVRVEGPQPDGYRFSDYCVVAQRVITKAADDWRIAKGIPSTTTIAIGATHDDYPHEFRTRVTYRVQIDIISSGFRVPDTMPVRAGVKASK